MGLLVSYKLNRRKKIIEIMHIFYIIPLLLAVFSRSATSSDVLGCGGFVKSQLPIDFSKVVVKMYTKQGILKDETSCAPNNGYYFFPVYDKGYYIIRLEPPAGWSFAPTETEVLVDGVTDPCSRGEDINFVFRGFGITGKVEVRGQSVGPAGVTVMMKSDKEVRSTVTSVGGNFFFTPVYPETYSISIEHPKWKIGKKNLKVNVAQGNTELPTGSLVINGYDVTGFVKSEGEPVKDVIMLLLGTSKKVDYFVEECDKSSLSELGKNVLCHVRTDKEGKFVFPVVSPGVYKVRPFYKSGMIHFEPQEIDFDVGHASVVLQTEFDITGFSIMGRVLDSANGNGIEEAEIYINGSLVGETKTDGSYVLDKIKAGFYTIEIKSPGYNFERKTLRVNPSLKQLPDIVPNSYEVCGMVTNDKPQSVQIKSVAEIIHITTETGGEFCVYLSPGTYEISVIASSDLLFFPVTLNLDITNKPIDSLVFSQLKATVSGRVLCLRPEDCKYLRITLRPTLNNKPVEGRDIFIGVTDNRYKIDNIPPGTYEISISSRSLCFETPKHHFTVSTAFVEVPDFKQNGYEIRFASSHETRLKYKHETDSTYKSLNLQKGTSTHCFSKSGVYNATLESCHTYVNPTFIIDTNDADDNEIELLAEKHLTSFEIETEKNYGPVNMLVVFNQDILQKMVLKYSKGGYAWELYLLPNEEVTLIPSSDVLCFQPPNRKVIGLNDCTHHENFFKGIEGLIFEGKVEPALEAVTISLEVDGKVVTVLTDKKGAYRFPPQERDKSFDIRAQKEGYVFVGPDEKGNFQARKLAELVVQVIDGDNGLPLQGALLSLSGGESYRSNLQTNEKGQITFGSLSPSDYFLRPMMKEYSFEPLSKMINIKEGESTHVLLKGKKVAYSVFGNVTTPSGDPDEAVTVIAYGLANCTQYSEEASFESLGLFRIRGLLPNCKYTVKVVGDDRIERSTPSEILITYPTIDIYDLHFDVFHRHLYTDIMVKIYTKDPENYKTLSLYFSRDSSSSSGIIYSAQLNPGSTKILPEENRGLLVHVPSVRMDNEQYSLRLESTLPNSHVQTRNFLLNSTFLYFEFEFTAPYNPADQQVKRTSMWTLIFALCVIFVGFNAGSLYEWLNEKLPPGWLGAWTLLPKQKSSGSEDTVDTSDIDQIVQSINAVKKKSKPKKI